MKKIINHFIKNYRTESEKEYNWFRKMTFDDSLKYSTLCITSKGLRHSHQFRLKQQNLFLAEKIVKSHSKQIKSCASFDELYNLIVKKLNHINGLGEVYFYDVALHIGLNLNLLPKKVYLHAGVRIGAKKLLNITRQKFIEMKDLPKEFDLVRPYEIEDILCSYKNGITGNDCSGKTLKNSLC